MFQMPIKVSTGIVFLAGLLFLCSCNGDNSPEVNGNEPTPTATGPNVNANKAYLPEFRRLEMPRRNGGTDTILVHKSSDGAVNYIVEWDYQKKSQRWSCYVLDKDYMQKNTDRYYDPNNQYFDDDLIPESKQWYEDPYNYNGEGLQHGHICPSADRLYARDANIQTFFLTNMQPQYGAFNEGIWGKLENKVREIARLSDTLYVCKGGTIDDGVYGKYNKVYRRLGNGLIIPRYFFMALLRVSNGTYSAIGIWTDQIINANDTGANMGQYAISIDELEQRTGIDFFCNLPDNIEDNVEKSYRSILSWNIQ